LSRWWHRARLRWDRVWTVTRRGGVTRRALEGVVRLMRLVEGGGEGDIRDEVLDDVDDLCLLCQGRALVPDLNQVVALPNGDGDAHQTVIFVEMF